MTPTVALDRDDLPAGYEVWCPECEANPEEPCGSPFGGGQRSSPHVSRRIAGRKAESVGVDPARVSCPTCGAHTFEPCRTARGRRMGHHAARWQQLEGGGAS